MVNIAPLILTARSLSRMPRAVAVSQCGTRWYSSNESGRPEVYVQTFPRSDRKWPVSTTGGYEPRWRADGGEIFYLSQDQKLMAVSVGPGPSFDVPQLLFQTRVPVGLNVLRTSYVPSRDGRRFLINTQSDDQASTPITVVLNWTAALK